MALESFDFLQQITLILVLAALVVVVFHRFHQPVILGYILSGVLFYQLMSWQFPHVLPDLDVFTQISELGLVMLIFSIGLHFNLSKFKPVALLATFTGIMAIMGLLVTGFILGEVFGFSQVDSLFLGGMISIASSGIIIKNLMDARRMDTEEGHIIIGILIVEDVLAVLLITGLSGFSTAQGMSTREMAELAIKFLLFFVITVGLGTLTVPRLIRYLNIQGSREILLLTVLGFCFTAAMVSHYLVGSTIFGAFVMGLVIAECPLVNRVQVIIAPVRDMFLALFFISIGFIIDLSALRWEHLLPIVVIALVFVVAKTMLIGWGTFFWGRPAGKAFTIGLGLTTIGEFSYIIAREGLNAGLISDFLFPMILMVSVVTIFINSFLIAHSDRIISMLGGMAPERFKTYLQSTTDSIQSFRDRLASSRKLSERVEENVGVVQVYGFLFILTLTVYWIVIRVLPSVMDAFNVEAGFGNLLIFGVLAGTLCFLILSMFFITRAAFDIIDITSVVTMTRIGPGTDRRFDHRRTLKTLVLVNVVFMMIIIMGFLYDDLRRFWVFFGGAFLSLVIIGTFVLRRELTTVHNNVMETFRHRPLPKQKGRKVRKSVPRIQKVFGNLMTIRETRVSRGSPFIDKQLKDTRIRDELGSMVLAIEREGKLVASPSADEVIQKGDILFLVSSDSSEGEPDLEPMPEGAQDRRLICSLGEAPPDF